ncbi:hypothetical protein Sru01_62430 [Sphaerisporangium rufum]|uniref:Uncharacterized protein n=1 Tax=Sphaerisporangium rufum TaxID=1381558 RepID=A0A919R7U1_9ACTN|nr:hypothetical protein Sru01_62430 [Sphaerisporangium rufum]
MTGSRAAMAALACSMLATGCGAERETPATGPERPVSTSVSPVPSGGVPTADAPASPTRPRGGTTAPVAVPWEKAEPLDGGRRLRILWWSGVEPCHVLDRVALRETGTRVTVTLYEGHTRENVACIEMAVRKSTEVTLKQPVDGRKVVDGARP